MENNDPNNELSVDGVSLSYKMAKCSAENDLGTLVFIHGNSSCKEAFTKQIDFFKAKGFGVLAIDLPGHGASANAEDPVAVYTMPNYAQILETAISALVGGDYVVVGWSLGGNIALEMAGNDLQTENKAMKGIFIFGAPPVGPGMLNIEKAYLPATFASAVGDANPSEAQIKEYIQMVYGTLDPVPNELIAAAKRADGRARETMAGHWMGGGDGHIQNDTIANWKKPIGVLHGNQDPFVSLDYLKEANWRNLWRGQIHEISESGHAPFIEFPQVFNEYLEQFAKETFAP